MSKYAHGVFFTTAYSNISPPSTSFDMARSYSRDSATSTSHYYPTSQPMSRTSSSNSYTATQPTSAPMRRTSSSSSSQSTWIASPYRSCLNRGTSYGPEEPSSYLSDDELLCLSSFPVESLPSPCLKKVERKEMTTEEQIQHLRDLQEQEEREKLPHCESGYPSNSVRRKTVRFEPEVQRKPRRPSNKRRSNTCRNQLRTLNGPM